MEVLCVVHLEGVDGPEDGSVGDVADTLLPGELGKTHEVFLQAFDDLGSVNFGLLFEAHERFFHASKVLSHLFEEREPHSSTVGPVGDGEVMLLLL